jgi:hypothetical protein
MGSACVAFILLLEERNLTEVGTLQPSLGFKDFHQAARLHSLTGGHPEFDGGEKQAGLRPLPRPQLQGSSSSLLRRGARRAGALPPVWAGGPPLPSAFRGEGAHRPSGGGGLRQRGAVRSQASSAPACLARWLSWLWRCFRCHLPPLGRSVAVRSPWAAVAPCAPEDRLGRRTPLGRRSCSWIVLSPLRHNASVQRSVHARPRGLEWGSTGALWGGAGGQVAAVVGVEVVAAGEGFSADKTVGATCGRTSGSSALAACPCPSSGDVGEGLVAAASALRSSLLLSCRSRRRSLTLLQWSAVGHLEFVVPHALRCGGCSYLREWNRSSVCNGTLSVGVCSLWLSRPEHLGI